MLLKQLEMEFLFLISWLVTTKKGLDGLAETIHFLEDLGVSAIEVGIPFSDPCR